MATNHEATGQFSGGFQVTQGILNNIGSINAQTVNFGCAGETSHFSRLSYVGSACFNSTENEKKGPCLNGTRVDLLNDIVKWCETSNGKHIFWLSGWAGTGKSTIARTVARIFHDKNRLAASFFFSRDHSDTSIANSFATTIAYQLGDFDPHIKGLINYKLERHPHLMTGGISEQWKRLALDPLAAFGKQSKDWNPLLLVVDALDECASEDDLRLIVRLLAQVPQVCRNQLLVFLTSRPEYSIRLELSYVEHTELKLQSINENVVNEDISFFISKEFKKIATKLRTDAGWPGKQEIAALVKSSAGLFIWAATACRYVESGRTKPISFNRLKNLLQGSSTESDPQKKLDQIYTDILKSSIRAEWNQSERDEHNSSLRKILGAIILLRSPLSAIALGNLIDHPEIESTLCDLHSILHIPEDSNSPIRLHHPSFRDFFLAKLTQERKERHWDAVNLCLDKQMRLKAEREHRLLAELCLELMAKTLKRNICEQKQPGIVKKEISPSQINQCIPSELQYACYYWVDHLYGGNSNLSGGHKTHLFLQEHFLHWIEALIWLNMTFASVKFILNLQHMLDDSASELKELLYDAHRFTLNYCSLIDDAPLQLYCSALLFCPSETSIRKLFEKEIPPWIVLKPRVAEHWDSFHVLRYKDPRPTSWCSHHCIVFSDDGKYVAGVVSDSSTIYISIWEMSTGQLFRRFAVRKEESSWSQVYFSSNSRLLTHGWLDEGFNELRRETVDLVTGAWWDFPSVDKHFFNQSPVSSDGLLESSFEEPNTWYIRSTENGETLCVLGHPYEHLLLTFSPNPNQIATMNERGEIQILDITHYRDHKMSPKSDGYNADGLKAEGRSASLVEISQHGKYVGSYYADGYVRLWELGTKEVLRIMEVLAYKKVDNEKTIAHRYLVFSPDEKYVSFDGKGYELDVLPPRQDDPKWKVSDRRQPVSSAAFSRDGRYLAYGHYSGFISILQIPSGEKMHYFEAHKRKPIKSLPHNYIDAIAVSADLVVSTAWDNMFKIWDIMTASLIRCLRSPEAGLFCQSLIFTPDEQNIIIAYESHNHYVWDFGTAEAEPRLTDTDKRYGRWIKNSMISPSCGPVSPYVKRQDRWVTASGRKIIYLPENRGPPVDISVCEKANRIAIGSSTGSVTIIGLDGKEPYEI